MQTNLTFFFACFPQVAHQAAGPAADGAAGGGRPVPVRPSGRAGKRRPGGAAAGLSAQSVLPDAAGGERAGPLQLVRTGRGTGAGAPRREDLPGGHLQRADPRRIRATAVPRVQSSLVREFGRIVD